LLTYTTLRTKLNIKKDKSPDAPMVVYGERDASWALHKYMIRERWL